jgi:hypothetical protein
MDIVEEISNIMPMHIIVGNHDLWSKSASEINTIRPFKFMPNVFVYDKTSRIEYNGVKICMMPYIENKNEQIEQIKINKDCDYLFCHSDLNGCKMHLTSVAHKNMDKIDIDEFSPFKIVRSGHIHLVQSNKHFTFVGSPFQMDRNDYGDQKGIFIIDTNDHSEEFIPNNISPIFKKVRVITEDDIEKLEELRGSKDYIDISISNKLLISNRKLRRKLEILLETGSFSSVEYVDDITDSLNELEDNENASMIEESIMEGGFDISVQLDYNEYVKKYILAQKYDSDKFRDGVLEEYENVIEIYENNYNANKNN